MRRGDHGEGRGALVPNRGGGNVQLVTNNNGNEEALTPNAAQQPPQITNYNVFNIYVENVHINNHGRQLQMNDGHRPLETNDGRRPSQTNDCPDIAQYHPRFRLAPSCTRALTFGMAVPRRWYHATMHTDNNSQLISYMQTSSRAETTVHIMTAGLSPRHYHLVIFLFDTGPTGFHDADARWPQRIRLGEISSLIRDLGPHYEFSSKQVHILHLAIHS